MRRPRIAYLLLIALAIAGASIAHANERARPVSATEFRAILDKERGKVIVLNLWATWCQQLTSSIDKEKLPSVFKERGVQRSLGP